MRLTVAAVNSMIEEAIRNKSVEETIYPSFVKFVAACGLPAYNTSTDRKKMYQRIIREYMDYEMLGETFGITSRVKVHTIYEEKELPEITSKYLQHAEPLMIDLLLSALDNSPTPGSVTVVKGYRALFAELGLTNGMLSHSSMVSLTARKDINVWEEQEYIHDLIYATHRKTIANILHKLADRKIISYARVQLIQHIDTDTFEIANDMEEKLILECEAKVLTELKTESVSAIYAKGWYKKFKLLVDKQLEISGYSNYVRAFDIKATEYTLLRGKRLYENKFGVRENMQVTSYTSLDKSLSKRQSKDEATYGTHTEEEYLELKKAGVSDNHIKSVSEAQGEVRQAILKRKILPDNHELRTRNTTLN